MESLSSEGHATNLFFTNGGDTRGGQPFGALASSPALPGTHSVARGQKVYTIQRVNGNGGNGKTDGIGGGHRHTLEESDRVKKNSVQRFFLKKAKDEKKEVVSESFISSMHPSTLDTTTA